MHISEFNRSLSFDQPPSHFTPYLKAMWFAKNNEWAKAHALVENMNDRAAFHIHAYLHRVEGDLFNADYWYRKAGQTRPSSTLEEETDDIVAFYSKCFL